MTERKPRVYSVSDEAYLAVSTDVDVIDDDYLVSPSCKPQSIGALRDMAPDRNRIKYTMNTYIVLSQTERHADALDWFSDVINSEHARWIVIELNPSRAKVREKYPWINEFWSKVTVWKRDDHEEYSAAVTYQFDRKGRRNPETGLFDVSHDSAIQCTLIVVEINADDMAKLDKLADFSRDIQVVDQMRQPLAPWRLYFGLYSKLMSVPLPETTRRFVFIDERAVVILSPLVLDSRSVRDLQNLAMYPVETAELRWPHYHTILVDAAIPLLSIGLPVYVVLEIIDWLPKMDLWSRVRKVRRLESLYASICRVKPHLQIQ